MHALRLLTQQPQLLLEHVDGYSELLGQEIALASSLWRTRLLYAALTILLLGITLILGGVALMLWATQSSVPIHAAWLLWLVPVVPLLAALVCWKIARGYMQRSVFFDIRAQMNTDLAMLRGSRASA